jgi:signal transduction histidine kinase
MADSARIPWMIADPKAAILRTVASLAAAASHEINNPLMTIYANLELLEATQSLDAYGCARLDDALAAAAEIRDGILRLQRITRLEIADDGPNLPAMLDLRRSCGGP